jgi:hypothetical protein
MAKISLTPNFCLSSYNSPTSVDPLKLDKVDDTQSVSHALTKSNHRQSLSALAPLPASARPLAPAV